MIAVILHYTVYLCTFCDGWPKHREKEDGGGGGRKEEEEDDRASSSSTASSSPPLSSGENELLKSWRAARHLPPHSLFTFDREAKKNEKLEVNSHVFLSFLLWLSILYRFGCGKVKEAVVAAASVSSCVAVLQCSASASALSSLLFSWASADRLLQTKRETTKKHVHFSFRLQSALGARPVQIVRQDCKRVLLSLHRALYSLLLSFYFTKYSSFLHAVNTHWTFYFIFDLLLYFCVCLCVTLAA